MTGLTPSLTSRRRPRPHPPQKHPHPHPRRWLRVRLGGVAASAALFALAVVVLGSVTPGYDQWSDAVSRLASPGERWALAARAAFAAYGLLVVAGASTLRQCAGRHGHTLARCLALYGTPASSPGWHPRTSPARRTRP